MKKLTLLLLCLTFAANAAKLEVDQMTLIENYDLKFILESSSSQLSHIELDCQSFFQKVDFFDENGQVSSENFISINECEYLYQQTYSCLKKQKSKCFDSDFLFRDSCDCED